MKKNILYIIILAICTTQTNFAQDKNKTASIINKSAVIKKFYDKKELSDLPKGQLLELCIERLKVITKTLPYISLATGPGATMTDVGIPNSTEYKKNFEEQETSTNTYLDDTTTFQGKILPYSDKEDLIRTVLFYESILKSLYDFKDI